MSSWIGNLEIMGDAESWLSRLDMESLFVDSQALART